MNKLVYVLMAYLVGVNVISSQSQSQTQTQTEDVYTVIPYNAASKKLNFIYADSCRIAVVYSEDNDILVMSCGDSSFSVEGVRPGQKLAEKLKGKKIEYVSGWDYYINIIGNWYAGFRTTWVANNKMPTDTSTIAYLYWFKFNYDHPFHHPELDIKLTEEELKEIEKEIEDYRQAQRKNLRKLEE